MLTDDRIRQIAKDAGFGGISDSDVELCRAVEAELVAESARWRALVVERRERSERAESERDALAARLEKCEKLLREWTGRAEHRYAIVQMGKPVISGTLMDTDAYFAALAGEKPC